MPSHSAGTGKRSTVPEHSLVQSGMKVLLFPFYFECSLFAHFDRPAKGILGAAPLDSSQFIVQALGDRTNLAAADFHLFGIAPVQEADGGDDGSRTGAEGFFQFAGVVGFSQLVDGDAAFGDLKAPAAHQFDGRFPGDAAQDRTIQRGGDDLAVDFEEDVHSTDFFDVTALHTVQPQHLSIVFFLSFGLGFQGSGIVAGGFGEAGAAADRTDILGFHINAHRVEALGIIGAHRGSDDDKVIMLAGMHAQMGIDGNDKGTQIEGGILGMRNPILLHAEEFLQVFHHFILVHRRDAQAVVGQIEAGEVLLRAEQEVAAQQEETAAHRIAVQRRLLGWITGGCVLLAAGLLVLWMFYRQKRSAYRILVERSREWARKQTAEDLPLPVADDDRLLMHRVHVLLKEEHLYRDPDLTLDSMATRLDVHRNTLSRVINLIQNQNFNQYINDFRLREVIERLSDSADCATILDIAFSAGFRSQQTFYRLFKTETGLSPALFRKNSAR